MKKIIFIFSLILLSNICFAEETQLPIIGTWKTKCFPVKKHYAQATITFSNSTNHLKSDMYAKKNDCENNILINKTASVEVDFNYILGNSFGEGFVFDYIPTGEIKLTLLRQDVVDYYNNKNGCDLTGWLINVPKNVSGKICPIDMQMPKTNKKYYDIYNFTEDSLAFGLFPTALIDDEANRPQNIKVECSHE